MAPGRHHSSISRSAFLGYYKYSENKEMRNYSVYSPVIPRPELVSYTSLFQHRRFLFAQHSCETAIRGLRHTGETTRAAIQSPWRPWLVGARLIQNRVQQICLGKRTGATAGAAPTGTECDGGQNGDAAWEAGIGMCGHVCARSGRHGWRGG